MSKMEEAFKHLFGRLTPWRGDIVFDLQKKPHPTPKEH